MTNLSKSETIESIEETIKILDNASSYLTYIEVFSNHVYQSRIDQFITTTEKTIRSLEKIKESI